MPRFAANLSMLFTEYPFLERFDRAAAAGFQGVEFLFPYQEDIPAIRDALRRNGLTQALFNLPAGDFAAGDRGIANDPARVPEFRRGVERALEIAATLGCEKLNCLAGMTLADVPLADQWSTLAENLAFAAEQAARAGILQVVEPLNTIDTPGFLLGTPTEAFGLVERIGQSNLSVQYDVYHAQRMEGNLTATIGGRSGLIGHIQVADSPGRHQPGTGEINYPFVFQAIDDAGYDGWVSLEYRPLGTTEASLRWLVDWGYWTRP
ncbi:MAG TPA: 2-oxo-tetronate isomerase [Thermomicrobiales bacterium]|nr:2-oxo-tetronate isomerase [Thermomicrobiales bacterium]